LRGPDNRYFSGISDAAGNAFFKKSDINFSPLGGKFTLDNRYNTQKPKKTMLHLYASFSQRMLAKVKRSFLKTIHHLVKVGKKRQLHQNIKICSFVSFSTTINREKKMSVSNNRLCGPR